MPKTITLHDDIYRRMSSYGNRDESHNTIILRLLENLDEEEAKQDRNGRKTVFESEKMNQSRSKNSVLENIDNGTKVRYKMKRGDYAGEERIGTVKDCEISFNDNKWSPTGFARAADKDIRGSDARSSEAYRGPTEVEFQDESGKWVPIKAVLER